ncbi:hypothetical protein [Bradyrhizobium sp. USDA 10063]
MKSRTAAFLAQIEAFLTRTGLPPTVFGKVVLNDPNFVKDLRQGRRPNLDLVEHVEAFMAQFDDEVLSKRAGR